MNDFKKKNKFEQVPVEEDTRILFRTVATLGKYDVLYEKWFWDGITAESIIFVSEDVADLKDSEIEDEVKTSPLVNKESPMTLKRDKSGFTFVNFNLNFNFDLGLEYDIDDVLTIYKDERTREEKQRDRDKVNQFIADKNNAEITRIKKRKSY